MFRYRCPHCRQILQALEIRAGKNTICSKCSRPLTIPSDRTHWLNERGEPLAAAPTLNLAAGGNRSAPADEYDAGDDVLGAIFVGSDASPSGATAKDPPPVFTNRPQQPAAELPPNYPPRTGRIPFPLPDTPRSTAWLIPPSRAEEPRVAPPPSNPELTRTPAPAPRPEPKAEEPPAEVARTAEPPTPPPEPEPPRPPEPEDTVVAFRNEPPPAPEPEEPAKAESDSIFDMEQPAAGDSSTLPVAEVGATPPAVEPVAETKPVEPPAPPKPDDTVVAAATPPPPHPEETLIAPRTPPAPPPARTPTPPPVRKPEPRKGAAAAPPPREARPPEPPREVRPPEPPRRPTPPPQPVPPPREEPQPQTRSAPRGPRLEPVAAPVTPPRGTAAPAPRRRLVITTPAPLPQAGGGPGGFAEPFRAHEQEEVAAHLATALTTRMKPPPEPPRDLRPSTAVWLIATGIALALLMIALVTSGDYLRAVGFIGLAEVVVGYGWIVWLTFSREPKRGLLCAVPVLTGYYLVQRKYAKFRPLRFVATGLVLVILAGAAGTAQPRTRGWAGVPDPSQPITPAVDLEKQPKLVQIRAYRERRSLDSLVKVLDVLSKTDPTFSEDAKDRVELVAELRPLTADQQTDVRVAALSAYARWSGGDEARAACLRFVASESQDERRVALKLLPRWKDPEVARSVAARIGRPSTETTLAVESLLEIGGPAAEQAALPLLRADDQGTRLTAIDILERVGGADALEALTGLSTSDDPVIRQRATAKAQVIKARLQKK